MIDATAGPSITDWMQGIGTLTALVVSISSLIWQWRTRVSANQQRIQVIAQRQSGDVWTVEVVVQMPGRHRAIEASVEKLDWSATRLFFDEGPPWYTTNLTTFAYEERHDWSDIRADETLHMQSIRSPLEYDPDGSTVARGYFGIIPDQLECRIRVIVRAAGDGSKLLTRTLTISPVEHSNQAGF